MPLRGVCVVQGRYVMKLRLGQEVRSTDGLFGSLGDIVVDPVEKAVTHVVVEPTLGYYQSRLVPIWLVTEADEVLTVQLDEKHLRQLQRVSYAEYVHHDEILDVGDAWDIGTEDVVTSTGFEADSVSSDDYGVVEYEGIPKGECEIRRTSEVVSSDGAVVGHVDGFVADTDKVSAVVVRTGLPGLRHDVLVPFSAIDRVVTDRIELSIHRDAFFDLRRTGNSGADDDAMGSAFKQRTEQAAAKLATRGRDVATTTLDKLRRNKSKA